MIDFVSILPWISMAVGLITIYAFFKQRRDITVAEGERNAENKQLKEEVRVLKDKVSCLETENRGTEKSVAVIEANITHIIESLNRIEAKLEKRIEATLEKHEE